MLYFYRICLVVLMFIGSQSALANDEPITIHTQGNIPNVAYVNKSYTLTYTLTNTLGFKMPTPLTIEQQASSDDFVISDGCSGKPLKEQESCQVQIVFTPSQVGEQTLGLTMAYAHYRVPFSQVVVQAKAEVVLEGKASISLDPNIAIRSQYPVQLTFTNPALNPAVTQLTTTEKFPPEFTLIENTCAGKATLLPGMSCYIYIKGELTATQAGPLTVAATLRYVEGRPLPVSTHSSAEQVVVTGEASEKLDPNIAVGIQYPVQLTFTNTSPKVSATGLNFTYDFPKHFTIEDNGCQGKTVLLQGQSCNIKGHFTAPKTGPVNIAATLRYAEGQPVTVAMHSSAEPVVVNGEVTQKLDPNIAVGVQYPVQLTFTNTSAKVSATGLNFTYDFPKDFIIENNGCQGKTVLLQEQSCNIKGHFTATQTGPVNIAATLRYAEGQPVTATTSGSAEKVVVTGEATRKLDANIAVGVQYPVQLTFTNTSANVSATGLQFLTNFDPAFVVNTNTCNTLTTLAAGKSCYVSGELRPTTTNSYTVAATLRYAEGQPVTATTSGSAEPVVVTGEATRKLDANIAVGVQYPVQLTFTNTSAKVSATGLQFLTNFDPAFVVNTDTCNTLTTLAAGKSCYVSGELRPTTANSHTVAATLRYAEGQPVTATMHGSAEQVVVTGEEVTKLDPNIPVGIQYPVQLTFTNTSAKVSATGLNFTYDFPKDFIIENNGCQGKTVLLQGQSCNIKGHFTATKTGPVNIAATLRYAEGQPVTATTYSSAEQVVVDGEIEKLPDNVEKDTTYHINFTFRNTNSNLSATSVHVTKNFPAGFTEKVDTCNKTMLSPNSTCEISGDFKATTNGPVTLSATLNYKEGNPVPLTINSNVTDVDITGAVTKSLPADYISSAQTYPVVFSFANNNDLLPAKNVQITKNFPAGFTEKVDTCNKTTLSPNSTCEISGDFKATTNGSVTLSVTLSYKEGSPVMKKTSATVFTFSPPSADFTSNTKLQANLDDLYRQLSLSGTGQRIGYTINTRKKEMLSGPTSYNWSGDEPSFANTTEITVLDDSGRTIVFKVWNNLNYMNSLKPTLNGRGGFPQTRLFLQPANYDALPAGTTKGTLYLQAYWWNLGRTYDFRVYYSIKK